MSIIKEILTELYNDIVSLFKTTSITDISTQLKQNIQQQSAAIISPSTSAPQSKQIPSTPSTAAPSTAAPSKSSAPVQLSGSWQDNSGTIPPFSPTLSTAVNAPSTQSVSPSTNFVLPGVYTPALAPSPSLTRSPAPANASSPSIINKIYTSPAPSSAAPSAAPSSSAPSSSSYLLSPTSLTSSLLTGVGQSGSSGGTSGVSGSSSGSGGSLNAQAPSPSASGSSINPTNGFNLYARIDQNGPDYSSSMTLPDGRVVFVPGFEHSVGIFNPNTNNFDKISPRQLSTPDPYSSLSASTPSSAYQNTNPVYITFKLRFPAYTPTTFSQLHQTSIIDIYTTLFTNSKLNATISILTISAGSAIVELLITFNDGNINNATQLSTVLVDTLILLQFIDKDVSIDYISPILNISPNAIVTSQSPAPISSANGGTVTSPAIGYRGPAPSPSSGSRGPAPSPSSGSRGPAPSPSSGSRGPAPSPSSGSRGPAPSPSIGFLGPAPSPVSGFLGPAPSPSSGSRGPAPSPSSGTSTASGGFAPAPSPSVYRSPVSSSYGPLMNNSKKGFVVGNSDTVGGAKVSSLLSKWYYTWGSTPVTPGPTGLLFTPMVWNINKTPNIATVLTTLQTLNVNGQENILLAYNEPDGTNISAQGDMTVGQAIQYWPQLVATNRRLGSPVMYGSLINVPTDAPGTGKNINNTPQPSGITYTNGTTQVNISNDPSTPNIVTLNPLIWLDNFLIQVSQITPKTKFPDFITVHWYGPPNPTSFLNYLQEIYNKYHLPIWVTEYSVADWSATFDSTANRTVHTAPYDWSYPTGTNLTTNATAVFMKDTIQGMNAMPFVERYSWKERYLLSPAGTAPTSNNSVEGPTNPDVMGQSALFQSYEHSPTTLPPLTPLGQLYASL
jgi:hypothetical protein